MRSYFAVVLERGKLTVRTIQANSRRMVRKICAQLGLEFKYIQKCATRVFTTSDSIVKRTETTISRYCY